MGTGKTNEVIYIVVKKVNKKSITIGSDPEFIYVQGVMKHGANVVHNLKMKGRNDVSKAEGIIGVDGHSSTGELRPKYADGPRKHCENIKKLIGHLADICGKDYKVYGGSYPAFTSIGGHIHFGPSSVTQPHKQKIADALDLYFSMPMLFVENKSEAKKRRTGSYGKLGDIRDQDWGVEYRTPSSWIVSPEMAESVLCLAYTIVNEVVNNKNFKVNDIILSTLKVDGGFCNGNVSEIEKYIGTLYKTVSEMELFSKYKVAINRVFKMVVDGETFNSGSDVIVNWGFKTSSDNRTKVIPSKDKGVSTICSKIKVGKSQTNLQLYVYGLKKERGSNLVLCSNRYLADIFTEIFKRKFKYDVSVETASVGERASSYVSSIGFSSDLRKNPKEIGSIIQMLVDEYEHICKE